MENKKDNKNKNDHMIITNHKGEIVDDNIVKDELDKYNDLYKNKKKEKLKIYDKTETEIINDTILDMYYDRGHLDLISIDLDEINESDTINITENESKTKNIEENCFYLKSKEKLKIYDKDETKVIFQLEFVDGNYLRYKDSDEWSDVAFNYKVYNAAGCLFKKNKLAENEDNCGSSVCYNGNRIYFYDKTRNCIFIIKALEAKEEVMLSLDCIVFYNKGCYEPFHDKELCDSIIKKSELRIKE